MAGEDGEAIAARESDATTGATTGADAAQLHAVERLVQELERLNTHRFVTQHNRPARLLGFHFLRGLAFGLGTALGATILVSVLAWWLAQFEFVPVLGDWAARIVDEIENAR